MDKVFEEEIKKLIDAEVDRRVLDDFGSILHYRSATNEGTCRLLSELDNRSYDVEYVITYLFGELVRQKRVVIQSIESDPKTGKIRTVELDVSSSDNNVLMEDNKVHVMPKDNYLIFKIIQ